MCGSSGLNQFAWRRTKMRVARLISSYGLIQGESVLADRRRSPGSRWPTGKASRANSPLPASARTSSTKPGLRAWPRCGHRCGHTARGAGGSGRSAAGGRASGPLPRCAEKSRPVVKITSRARTVRRRLRGSIVCRGQRVERQPVVHAARHGPTCLRPGFQRLPQTWIRLHRRRLPALGHSPDILAGAAHQERQPPRAWISAIAWRACC